jgi:hypothetical protein
MMTACDPYRKFLSSADFSAQTQIPFEQATVNSRFRKYFRGACVGVFLLSIPLFGLAASADQSIWFYVASILTWGALGLFCYTEGFWFQPPARTKLNIYTARFFFIGCSLIFLQILFVLSTGRAQ